MRKNVKKVIAPLLAAAMALSCTVCVSAAEDETIKLTVWGAEEDQDLLKEHIESVKKQLAEIHNANPYFGKRSIYSTTAAVTGNFVAEA